ncbi:calcineurin, partial [Coprococcus eutactus]|nr:calcineurin [Coprococcus eutactus]
GDLRSVQVDADRIHEVEIHNDEFKAPEIQEEQTVTTSSVADVIISLRGNSYIQEKTFGNISSFNFTSKAFNDRVWDEQT